jgi:CTP synthase (UTP-ammonia lyase)
MARQDPQVLDGSRQPAIGIVGDRNPEWLVHRATEDALSHLREPLPFEWVPTEEIAARPAERLSRYAALLVSPGSPYRSMEGALAAVRYAREREVPLLGTCGGFQHVVVEFARDVLGVADAEHEETSPGSPRLVVTALACSLAGQDHPVRLTPRSRIFSVYQAGETVEPFFCNYGLNAAYRPALEAHGLTVSGMDERGEPRVLELAGHPFFFATLYVPQARSRPGAPHPLVEALAAAAKRRAAR